MWAPQEYIQSRCLHQSQRGKALCRHLVNIWQDVFGMNYPLNKYHTLSWYAQLSKKKLCNLILEKEIGR